MNIHRLFDAGVRNVDRLFVPAGLPLVAKAGTGSPTTSILVRGGPGTGKTTLSLAFAAAIARENAGAVLFLTTEFSPAEVVVKAMLLGIPEESVLGWARRTEATTGSVLVQHLSATGFPEGEAEADSSALRKQRAMEAVWGMLEDREAPAAPIRAVVIDAFGLPDPEESVGKLRSDLVPFIQALEKRGVSTVLVEEAMAGGPDWLAFVTDVVFELSFKADVDTAELHRKLVCKKSRYAQAIPGPHDYGLEVLNGRPSVFPDPLLATDDSGWGSLPTERRGGLFIPLDEDGHSVWLRDGALVLNAFDRAGRRLARAVVNSPDLRRARWHCGPISTLKGGKRHVSVHESAGPYAACDALLSIVDDGAVNAVAIDNIGTLLGAARYRVGMPRVLDALRRRGYLVLVHGSSTELAALSPLADLDAEQRWRGDFRVAPARYRSVAAHLPPLDLLLAVLRSGLSDELPSAAEGRVAREIVDEAHAAEREAERGELEPAVSRLQSARWDDGEAPSWTPWVATASFLLSIALQRLGADESPLLTYLLARDPAMQPIEEDPSFMAPYEQFTEHTALHGPLAWAFATTGRESAAAYWCLQAFENADKKPNANGQLWGALQAIHAKGTKALEELLKRALSKESGPLFIGMALRALVAQARESEVDSLVTEYVAQHPIPPFMERRLRAEPLLRSRQVALREQARDALIAILDVPAVPALHRAEICFNVGRAYEDLGKSLEARPWYELARSHNPGLRIASEALARFNAPRASDALDPAAPSGGDAAPPPEGGDDGFPSED